jgi:membrane complex biogenesis BtpA family protein
MNILPPKFLAAMIALRALPGSPLYDGDDNRIVEQALSDLEEYKKVGVDSVILENDFDVPYIEPPLPEAAVKLTTQIAQEVRKRYDGPLGIQMLEAANETSLDIAAAANFDFIRVEGYVYGHVGPAGIIRGCSGQLLRKRKEMGCEQIKIYGDVKKKHTAHALTADLDIVDEIMQAELFLIDGVIITGKFTGVKPDTNDLVKAKKATELPVIIGSGITKENLPDYFDLADGFIVGSTFRKDGKFLADLEPQRLNEFLEVFKALKQV